MSCICVLYFFFFKQKTAYEMRISDWSSDVCSSDLPQQLPRLKDPRMDRLDALEAQSVYILREAYARIEPLAMLWSLGKDSNVMIWLARKAFFGHVPFPVMHVDTGKKFKEMYEFREIGRAACRERGGQYV